MGTTWLGNTVAANVWAASLTVQDEDDYDLYLGRYDWSYQQRNQRDTHDGLQWASIWPATSMNSGDFSIPVPVGLESIGLSWPTSFENSDHGESGTQRPYYVRGQCVNAVGAPQPGATVTAFRTATNLMEGPSVVSDSQGMFACPVAYSPSPNDYYVVAYLPGAPDVAGTTVNALGAAL